MAQRTLELTLISGKDLKDVNLLSKMEVYALVALSGDPRSRQRVPTDRAGGRNPAWNATLRFVVPANAAGSLHVLLRAERALGDRDVGEVHIPLSELLSGAPDGPVPVKFVAYQVRKIGSGKPQGALNFSYKLGEVTQAQPGAAYGAAPQAAYPPQPAYPPQSAYPPAAKADAYAQPPSAYPPTAKADAYPPPQSAYPPSAKADAYPPPAGYPPAGKTTDPSTAYPAPAGYPPAGKPSKTNEPVTAYPAAAAGPSTGAPYGAPPPQYGYGYPPPQQQPGYGYPPPPQQGGYGYGYPPQQPAGYGYQQQAVKPPKKAGGMGMGLGAGLLGGALGGLLIGDMISDAGSYDAGYDAGFDDGGGFDF
ncbi:protein SRC2-like [Lolium rigidum]|uniref:protein SRC2-like n=1 Tax=Lolium rigidum TaxID=89674 RepID=UPI001F5C1AE1|nr:protein SRC2-like [Lolium rigidum]